MNNRLVHHVACVMLERPCSWVCVLLDILPPVKLGVARTLYFLASMDHLGSWVFSHAESMGYDHWSKLIHTCDDTKCLWHDGSPCRPVDPKVWIKLNGVGTPFIGRWSKWSMFLEQKPKIFWDCSRPPPLVVGREAAPCELFFFFFMDHYLLLLLFGV